MPRRALLFVLVFGCLGLVVQAAGAAEAPAPQQEGGAWSAATAERRLVVKFEDRVGARADSGRLSSLHGEDLGPLDSMSLGWTPLLALASEDLRALEQRALRRSGRAQPDLGGMLIAHAGAGELEALRLRLEALPQVEWAAIELLGPPPPGDIAPPSPDFGPLQAWLGPDPGIDVDGAAHVPGVLGGGVRLSDCEFGWLLEHEDMVDAAAQVEGGQTPMSTVATLGWDEHGLAVLGITSAPRNGYGVDGAVPGAALRLHPEWTVEEGSRRASAVASAVADSLPGDVVLLEMQAQGEGGGFGPAELSPAIWTLTRVGTDAGVVVVAAAGNGAQDLDGPDYSAYRALGDSGALLVGAGSPDSEHVALEFSTYGSRVDLQGWGASVVTLGYGDLEELGDSGDRLQRYTASFAGTSPAAAIVAAAAVAVQSVALQELGAPLTPESLRDLLSATGIPAGAGPPIGPLVQVAAAVDALPQPVGQGTLPVQLLEDLVTPGEGIQGSGDVLPEDSSEWTREPIELPPPVEDESVTQGSGCRSSMLQPLAGGSTLLLLGPLAVVLGRRRR